MNDSDLYINETEITNIVTNCIDLVYLQSFKKLKDYFFSFSVYTRENIAHSFIRHIFTYIYNQEKNNIKIHFNTLQEAYNLIYEIIEDNCNQCPMNIGLKEYVLDSMLFIDLNTYKRILILYFNYPLFNKLIEQHLIQFYTRTDKDDMFNIYLHIEPLHNNTYKYKVFKQCLYRGAKQQLFFYFNKRMKVDETEKQDVKELYNKYQIEYKKYIDEINQIFNKDETSIIIKFLF
jgi:hypothetical protein